LTIVVAVTGGWRWSILGVRVSMTSPSRLAIWTVIAAAVRYLVTPRHAPLSRRPHLWPWRQIGTAAAYFGAIALFLVSFSRYYHPVTGFTHLTNGYDGQFYARLALSPLLGDRALARTLDAPVYRSRRILFSWTAWIGGMGQPNLVLQAYAVQNVLSWLLLAWLLKRWFPPGGVRAFSAWFACLFSHGMINSARFALLEGPSMLLIVLALVAIEHRRVWLSSAILGVSGLARETNLLAAVMLTPGDRRAPVMVAKAALNACVIVLPLFVWLTYVQAHFGGSGMGLRNFALPLSAYIEKWQVTLVEIGERGWRWWAHFSLYALISLTVNALFLLRRVQWRDPWWRVGAAYGAMLVVLGPAVWEGYPGAATRVVMPLTFAFNVLLFKDGWSWPLFLLGNLTVLHGLQVLDVPWSQYF
jgi:hypothetical protein